MLKNILLICVSFILFVILIKCKTEIFNYFGLKTDDNLVTYTIYYLVAGIPIFLTTYIISKSRNIYNELGLNKSIAEGFLFSVISVFPLLIGSFFLFKFDTDLNFTHLLKVSLFAAFFEELYFRGFLFQQLFKRTRLGFLPSVLLSALIFAIVHLYQATGMMEVFTVFVATFLGSILFAWLFSEWKFNLWVPIFLHTFMNLVWSLFAVSSNAGGGLYSNIFRIITILLAIFITIYWKKKRGEKLFINKKNLWIKQKFVNEVN